MATSDHTFPQRCIGHRGPCLLYGKIVDQPLFCPLQGHPERAKALFGAFGDAFEEYSNEILRRMFATPHFNLKKMDGKTTVFEVDALIAEGTSAFVFETKAKFLNEDLVSGNAYAGFVEHLREKYVSRGNAVWQLAKITAAMSADNWRTMPAELSVAKRIFPIVLTHDIRMDSPGTGMFLDQEMKRLNADLPSDERVQRLIVLTVNDLELLEGAIASGRLSLTDLLSGYLAELVNVDPLCSFHNYVAHSPYADQMQPSAVVRERAGEIIRNAQEVLFPKDKEP
ncbi:hypothetical protein AAFG13_15660 [Bradyrhizobium sp. B124]|uniref:hypothetical protein n=1 Tax=Bradyrhizobium sp. B124 TaxID=3140245 RepID=UPI003183C926